MYICIFHVHVYYFKVILFTLRGSVYVLKVCLFNGILNDWFKMKYLMTLLPSLIKKKHSVFSNFLLNFVHFQTTFLKKKSCCECNRGVIMTLFCFSCFLYRFYFFHCHGNHRCLFFILIVFLITSKQVQFVN